MLFVNGPVASPVVVSSLPIPVIPVESGGLWVTVSVMEVLLPNGALGSEVGTLSIPVSVPVNPVDKGTLSVVLPKGALGSEVVTSSIPVPVESGMVGSSVIEVEVPFS